MNIIGIDPSFTGLGLTNIDLDNKKIYLEEFSAPLGEGAFADITNATTDMLNTLNLYCKAGLSYSKGILFGMEIPPTVGFYAVKLYALDTVLYSYLRNTFNAKNVKLFAVSYLRYINGKSSKKEDTINVVGNLMGIFDNYNFSIIQDNDNVNKLASKNSKTLAYFNAIGFTHNQSDSFIYATRMLIRYAVDNPELIQEANLTPLITDIINTYPRLAIEKESDTGKTLKAPSTNYVKTLEKYYNINPNILLNL